MTGALHRCARRFTGRPSVRRAPVGFEFWVIRASARSEHAPRRRARDVAAERVASRQTACPSVASAIANDTDTRRGRAGLSTASTADGVSFIENVTAVVFRAVVRRAPGGEGKARTCTTPAMKPAAPPLKARFEASCMTSPKVIFFFSGSLPLPASWPMAGMGASARSLLVKPALSEASAGLARALTVNPRRGVWSSVADMVVAGGPACVRGRSGDRWWWIRSRPKGGCCHVRVGENSRAVRTRSHFPDFATTSMHTTLY